MTQNGHVIDICCRPAVDGDVVSGENVKSILISLRYLHSACIVQLSEIAILAGGTGDPTVTMEMDWSHSPQASRQH